MTRKGSKRQGYFIALLLLFVLQAGCPATCLVRPVERDYLTSDNAFLMDGFLLNYEDWEFTGYMANTDMPCLMTYFKEDYGAYQTSGAITGGCFTTSDENGYFRSDINLFAPGLYIFHYELPIVQPELQIVTYRPELEDAESPDQYVYIDFNSRFSEVQEAIKNYFQKSLAGEASSFELTLWTELTKIEVMRQFEAVYDRWRIHLADGPGENILNLQVVSCQYGFDGNDCLETSTGWTPKAGSCELDYPNQHLTNMAPCYVNLVPLIDDACTGRYFYTTDDCKSTNIDDPPEERVKDIAYAISSTIVHEFGHSLGLVWQKALWGTFSGDPGHNFVHGDSELAFLKARRDLPNELMRGGGVDIAIGRCKKFNGTLTPPPPEEGETIPRCAPYFNLFNTQYLDKILWSP